MPTTKLIFGKIFSKDGVVTGEQDTLRYSAYDTWLKSPSSYREKYYEGKSFTTAETVFGHEMHKVMETKTGWSNHPILSQVPRNEVSEKDIVVTIDGAKIGGRIDSFDPERREFIDYKFSHRNADGKAPWDAVKVAKHRQLVFYAILIEKKLGRVGMYHKLAWIETRFKKEMEQVGSRSIESDSRKLELTGDFKVFRRHVFKWEREAMKESIKKVAQEINDDFNKHKNDN